MKNLLLGAALAATTISFSPTTVQAQEVTNCTEITSLPATISASGVYCMMQNLGTNITSGAAITITANNVTLNMNGFRLGGSTAGPATQANGIVAQDRRNITIRNGIIRGFRVGVFLSEVTTDRSSGHLIENMLLDRMTAGGIFLSGTGLQVRNNNIVNIDSTPPAGANAGASFLADQNRSFSRSGKGGDTFVSQTGTGEIVIGIFATGASNSIFEGNFISNLLSPDQVYGIQTSNSTNINVVGNTIEDLEGNNFATGILLNDAGNDNIVVQNNTVIQVQANGDAFGIENFRGGTNINCFNNVVIGADTSQTFSCTNEAGTRP